MAKYRRRYKKRVYKKRSYKSKKRSRTVKAYMKPDGTHRYKFSIITNLQSGGTGTEIY